MKVLFIEAEARLFCLLITVFLFAFEANVFNKNQKKERLVYLFSSLGILSSALGGITSILWVKHMFFAFCGLFYALSVFFLYKGKLKNIFFSFFCLGFGILTFYSFLCKTNACTYIVVFALVFSFAINQYNKTRIDNLTKLYNRYGMDAELREQLRQYEKENTDSFYIIACDLDNFKHINDTWGHLEGDRALVLVARALSKVGKKFNSSVFRIGGDEFVIITDTSEKDLATNITTEIKKELDNIQFRDDFDIKMSIGHALYDGSLTIDELLGSADKKLYESKKNKTAQF